MKVVAITGSRDFPWRRHYEIKRVLEGAKMVILGDQRGADSIARRLCQDLRLDHYIAHVRSDLPSPQKYGERNGRMAWWASYYQQNGADVVCHAFPIGESPGTRNCVQQMTGRGIAVVLHEGPNDRQKQDRNHRRPGPLGVDGNDPR